MNKVTEHIYKSTCNTYWYPDNSIWLWHKTSANAFVQQTIKQTAKTYLQLVLLKSVNSGKDFDAEV